MSQYFISSKKQNILQYKSLALGPHSVVQTPSMDLTQNIPFRLDPLVFTTIPPHQPDVRTGKLDKSAYSCQPWHRHLFLLESNIHPKNTVATHFPVSWRLEAKQDRSP